MASGRERHVAALALSAITAGPLVLLLAATSPELSWDEAYRYPYVAKSWRWLWSSYDLSHGPMSVYLAKLGVQVLPAALGLEVRARFFAALVSSMAVGILYWSLRRWFGTSREAAATGAALLAFSVIRTAETNVIGPHHLILFCVVLMVSLGWRSLERQSMRSGIPTGLVFGFGALSSTYIVPVAAGWVLAVSVAGRRWRAVPMFSAAAFVALAVLAALWPAGVLRLHFLNDFVFYLRYSHHPTLVGDRIFGIPPPWAVPYWIAHLELPLLVAAALVLVRRRALTPRTVYLLATMAWYLAVLLRAHVAGARNLLPLVGVLCLATGAFFDDGIRSMRIRRAAATAVIGLACANFFVAPRMSTPYFATNGYRAFVQTNARRLAQPAGAMVYGAPVLNVYAAEADVPVRWSVAEMPWSTRADWDVPPSVRYVLMPAFVYECMPLTQPMRRTVAARWNVVWRFPADDAWELRLYERPPQTVTAIASVGESASNTR